MFVEGFIFWISLCWEPNGRSSVIDWFIVNVRTIAKSQTKASASLAGHACCEPEYVFPVEEESALLEGNDPNTYLEPAIILTLETGAGLGGLFSLMAHDSDMAQSLAIIESPSTEERHAVFLENDAMKVVEALLLQHKTNDQRLLNCSVDNHKSVEGHAENRGSFRLFGLEWLL